MSMTDMNIDVSITGQRGHAQAIAFAAKGGSALSDLLGSIAKNKEAERSGPLRGMLFLTQHFSEGDQHAIPVPGTKKGETGNLPYDKYTTEMTTKDGKKKVPGSWFTDVVKMTDAYQERFNIIAWCDKLDVEDKDGNVIPRPEWIVKAGDSELRAYKKQARQAITDMRTGLTKSAMLFHHAETISTLNPDRIKVKMPFKAFKNGDETEVRVISNIIRLIDPADETEAKEYSVSEFLALKPEKLEAMEKDKRTTIALDETKVRGVKGGNKKGTKTTYPVPTNIEQLLNLCNVGGTALDMETEQGQKLNALILTAIAGKKMDVIETFGDFAMKIDGIWTQIAPIYMEIKASKAKAGAEQAQAERTARTAR